jgi:GH18 family chitinase
MRELHAAFQKSKRLLSISIAIPASSYSLQHYDLPQLSRYVSKFHLMAYDLDSMYLALHCPIWDVKANLGRECRSMGIPQSSSWAH